MKTMIRVVMTLAMLCASVEYGDAFVNPPILMSVHQSPPLPSSFLRAATDEPSTWESIQADLQMRWKIAQDSNAQGSGFKQVVADVLAGEYDPEPIQRQIETDIKSAPVVMYTWKASPSCKSAIQALEIALGVPSLEEEDDDASPVRIIRLDDPWSDGNPIRAQLGKRVGRTSVPCIFISGNYVGGFDAGMGPETPGIQTMAFQGTLRPALEAAGSSLPTVVATPIN